MFSIATLLAQLPSTRSGERPISPRIAASIARQMPIPPQPQRQIEIPPVRAAVLAPARMLELSHPVREEARHKVRSATAKQKSKRAVAKRPPQYPETQALGYAASPLAAQEPFSPYVH
jgi:hypothetical protein